MLITSGVHKHCLEWEVRVELELWNEVDPWSHLASLGVDVEVKDVAVGWESDSLELVQPPLGELSPIKNKFKCLFHSRIRLCMRIVWCALGAFPDIQTSIP